MEWSCILEIKKTMSVTMTFKVYVKTQMDVSLRTIALLWRALRVSSGNNTWPCGTTSLDAWRRGLMLELNSFNFHANLRVDELWQSISVDIVTLTCCVPGSRVRLQFAWNIRTVSNRDAATCCQVREVVLSLEWLSHSHKLWLHPNQS